jgi:hypothetical protein
VVFGRPTSAATWLSETSGDFDDEFEHLERLEHWLHDVGMSLRLAHGGPVLVRFVISVPRNYRSFTGKLML